VYYLGAHQGCTYGADTNLERYRSEPFTHRTPIKKFWLTGQDAFCAGWAGALYSGIITADEILGYLTIPRIIADRHVIDDLMGLPPLSATDFPVE